MLCFPYLKKYIVFPDHVLCCLVISKPYSGIVYESFKPIASPHLVIENLNEVLQPTAPNGNLV